MSADVWSRRRAWHVSPQQTDPLSWFTRPLIPLIFAVMAAIYGIGVVIATWSLTSGHWLNMVAVALIVGGCLLVQLWTGPLRGTFSNRHAAVPLLLGIAAMVFATTSARESAVLVQHWWAPIGVGFLIAALTPYTSVARTIAHGSILTVAAGIGAAIAFGGRADGWGILSTIVIAVSGVVVSTVACAVFAWGVVISTQRLIQGADATAERPGETAEAARQAERRTIARLGSRVAPFLEKVAEAGVVTDGDRALAGQLARRLRADLVGQANRSWLDSLALSGPLYVVDPDHRAGEMNTVQRTAMRGLLHAIMKDPITRTGSIFVELRGQDDGSTAVAISLDVDLPEGRRVMMIAPYYLTLKGAADDLQWDAATELVRFRLPAPPREG